MLRFGSARASHGQSAATAVGVMSLGCLLAASSAMASVSRAQEGESLPAVSAASTSGSAALQEASISRSEEQSRPPVGLLHGGRAAPTTVRVAAAEPPAECQLVVADAALRGLASLSGGGSSVAQVVGTPLVGAFSNLPPALSDSLLQAYSQFVDATATGSKALGDTALAANEATNSTAPLVNPVAKPIGTAAIDSGVAFLGQAETTSQAAGLQLSFFDWLSAALVQYKTTFGLTDAEASACEEPSE